MSKKVKTALSCALLAALVAAVPSATLHFDLSRSVPEAGATVPAPSEITLWFTEVPQDNSISIRLIDPRGDLVDSTEPNQDAEDGTMFSIAPSASVAPGEYTVAWRGIGQDGHTVRGDFGFTVGAR
ncbi:MAG: copper resistance protein CopC [Gemmatimonadota bacterium]|nr:copper resistance protein CopC [Gemmatimonadota bacterium]